MLLDIDDREDLCFKNFEFGLQNYDFIITSDDVLMKLDFYDKVNY